MMIFNRSNSDVMTCPLLSRGISRLFVLALLALMTACAGPNAARTADSGEPATEEQAVSDASDTRMCTGDTE